MSEELCFDTLEDLSAELFVDDYVQFVTINDLTGELWDDMPRRLELHKIMWHNKSFLEFIGYFADLKFIKWFRRKGPVGERVLVGALRKSHEDNVRVVEWLHYDVNIRTTKWAMLRAVEYDNIEMLKWLIMMNLKGERRDECPSYVITEMCHKGHFGIVRLLYRLTGELPEWALYNACNSGHLELAKWVYKKSIRTYKLRIDLMCCAQGHLNIIKWLHTAKPKGIRLASANDIFKMARYHEHFDITRWVQQEYLIGDTIPSEEAHNL